MYDRVYPSQVSTQNKPSCFHHDETKRAVAFKLKGTITYPPNNQDPAHYRYTKQQHGAWQHVLSMAEEMISTFIS